MRFHLNIKHSPRRLESMTVGDVRFEISFVRNVPQDSSAYQWRAESVDKKRKKCFSAPQAALCAAKRAILLVEPSAGLDPFVT